MNAKQTDQLQDETVKVIYFDIDQTLFSPSLGIPPSAKTALETCRKRDIYTVICTGRTPVTIQDEVLEQSWNGKICADGSWVEWNGKQLCADYISYSPLDRILKLCKTEEAGISLETDAGPLMNAKAAEILNAMNKAKKSSASKEKIVPQDNLERYTSQPVFKICLWLEEKDAAQSGIEHEIRSLVERHGLKLIQDCRSSDQIYLEIIPGNSGKGRGVRMIEHALAGDQRGAIESYCFGDGLNDLDMFKAVKHSIAMGNAHPSLKEQAETICEPAEENGIYNELKRRCLI